MKTNVFVRTKNVKKFVGLMEDLKKLPPNIPKLALIYGDHGIGKTQTLLWWATKNDAIYIRANNDITQNGLLKIIMEELDISPYWNIGYERSCSVNVAVCFEKPCGEITFEFARIALSVS